MGVAVLPRKSVTTRTPRQFKTDQLESARSRSARLDSAYAPRSGGSFNAIDELTKTTCPAALARASASAEVNVAGAPTFTWYSASATSGGRCLADPGGTPRRHARGHRRLSPQTGDNRLKILRHCKIGDDWNVLPAPGGQSEALPANCRRPALRPTPNTSIPAPTSSCDCGSDAARFAGDQSARTRVEVGARVSDRQVAGLSTSRCIDRTTRVALRHVLSTGPPSA